MPWGQPSTCSDSGGAAGPQWEEQEATLASPFPTSKAASPGQLASRAQRGCTAICTKAPAGEQPPMAKVGSAFQAHKVYVRIPWVWEEWHWLPNAKTCGLAVSAQVLGQPLPRWEIHGGRNSREGRHTVFGPPAGPRGSTQWWLNPISHTD